jgi:hypothetical protein
VFDGVERLGQAPMMGRDDIAEIGHRAALPRRRRCHRAGRFAEAMRQLERRVTYVADPTSDTSLPSLLVRPDEIIVWATTQDSEATSDDAQKRLGAATERWVAP